MDASEAREHLQWVDSIVRTADRTLHMPPVTLIAWGIFGVVVNALHQMRLSGLAVPPDAAVHLPMLLAAAAVSVWAAARTSVRRQTVSDSYAGVVFGVVFVVLMLVNVTAQHTVVPMRAMALFWSVGFSIALLVIGVQASRPLLWGGLAMAAAGITACLVPAWFDGILALGWAAGFVAPGIALLRGSDGRAAAV